MTPNRIYQVTVEALESVLAPRVVSLVLREGLGKLGRTPADMVLEDVESVLTEPAFRHLQALMPPDQARSAVTSFLERIRSAIEEPAAAVPASAASGGADPADATAVSASPAARPAESEAAGAPADAAPRIEALRTALRPFNLYFDWPEVRKLRAQLQVAEQELSTGLDAGASLDDAAAQLLLVEQKLEDQLVLQARELGELEEAYAIVQSLGGPRVRRLEALIGQIRHAQRDRELAEAEVQRAASIARDLRKLMESSVAQPYADDAALPPADDTTTQPASSDDELAPVTIDAALLPPEVSERLRRLDLDAERKQLEALEARHAELLRYLPSLAEGFAHVRAALAQEQPVGDALAQLGQELDDAAHTQRSHLQQELDALAEQLEALRDDDDGSLERALRVTLDVLREGLPPHADVVALRALYRGALDRADERARREAEAHAYAESRRQQQRAALQRLSEAVERDTGETTPGLDAPRQRLHEALTGLRTAEAEERLDEIALERAHQAEQHWEHALAERADDHQERLRARLRELEARLTTLPDTPALRARRAALRREVSDSATGDQLSRTQVATLTSLVEQLQADASAELAQRLDLLGKEAGDVSQPRVLRALQEAARELQSGRFPDVARLRALVGEEREHARERHQIRWQRLQQARVRLEPAGVAGIPHFSEALDSARSALDAGRSADAALAAAEAALDQVEEQIGSRLASFGPRLDTALATFAQVALLNNDDVAAVRRVLTHLDSQRDALRRISPGLQHQLDRSLAEAEHLLEGLAQAYEATRAIADQLVAGKVLDDVLGAFDAFAAEPVDDPDPASEAGTAGWAVSAPLQTLLADFHGLDDVDAAAVVSEDGDVRAGDLSHLDVLSSTTALRSAVQAWRALGAGLDADEPQLIDLALGDSHALLTAVGHDSHALLVVRSGGAISALTARLREQRPALVSAVADAARGPS